MSGYVPKHAPLIDYKLRLGTRPRYAFVTIPEDITPEEANRLANIIRTLPMEETDAPPAG